MAFKLQILVDDQGTAKVKSLGGALQATGKQAGIFGDVLKANLASDIITAGMNKLIAGVRNLIASGQGIIDLGDKYDKMSKRIGISTESLSALSYVSNLAGTDIDSLETGVLRLTRGMTEAAAGQITYLDSFNAIGISVKDNEGNLKDVINILPEIADKFSNLSNNTQKAALAQELFGKSGAQLIPLLSQGSEAIKQQFKEAEKLGVVIGKDAADAAAKAADAQTRFNAAMDGLKLDVIVPLLEPLADLFTGVSTAVRENRGAFGALTKVINVYIEGSTRLLEHLGLINSKWDISNEEMERARENIREGIGLHDRLTKKLSEQANAMRENGAYSEKERNKLAALTQSIEFHTKIRDEESKKIRDDTQVKIKAILIRKEEQEKIEATAAAARSAAKAAQEELTADIASNTAKKEKIDLSSQFIISEQQNAEIMAALNESARIESEAKRIERELEIELMASDFERERAIIFDDYFQKQELYKNHSGVLLALEKKANKDAEEVDKKRLVNERAINKERIKNYMELASVFLDSVSMILEASGASAVQKGRIAQGEAIVNTAKAVTNALAQFPIPLNYAAAALVGLKGASQVAIIEKNIKYHDGGQIPGYGGETAATLEKGEAVIDKETTRRAGGFQGIVDKVNSAMESGGSGRREININISGNVFGTKNFIRDEMLPALVTELERR